MGQGNRLDPAAVARADRAGEGRHTAAKANHSDRWRAGKSAAFCFDRSADIGSGRETLWISPTTEIRFRFNGNRAPRINEQWLQLIIATADASTGLRLVAEPVEVPILLRSAG